jgi:hypothetical protein
MPKIFKKPPTACEIAARATRGENISAYFTNKFTVVRLVRKPVNKKFPSRALDEGRAGKTQRRSKTY